MEWFFTFGFLKNYLKKVILNVVKIELRFSLVPCLWHSVRPSAFKPQSYDWGYQDGVPSGLLRKEKCQRHGILVAPHASAGIGGNHGSKECQRHGTLFQPEIGISNSVFIKSFTFLIAALIFSFNGFAQTPTGELEMEIESIAEGNEENETDLTQLAESLQILQQNPVQINFAELEDFQKIPQLNIFQIANLLNYRDLTGTIYTPYELQAVKGFDRETIEKILPYLDFATETSTPEIKAKNVLKYSRHNLMFRGQQILQERRGFERPPDDGGYLGSPQNLYIRYRGTYRDLLSVGILAQQDAGEPLGGEFQNTFFDHLSGHIALQNYGDIRNFIVGDFQAEFGQGLALWTGLAFGKSAQATDVKRYARGFRPFTGAEENRFLRGAAATYRFFDALDVSAFYSKNNIDGNRIITDDSLQTFNFVSSLQATGLHRTLNELEDKNSNALQTFGGNINYKGNRFSTGFTAVNYQLETPLEISNRPYQKFRFSGKELSNFSLDANYIFKSINLFGEIAADDSLNLAGTIGFQSNPVSGFYLTVLHRHLDKKYRALYNAPFAESGSNGESGTYFGFQWNLSPVFVLKSYVDVYRFDWLRFRTDAPSEGRDFLAQLETYFNRRFSGYIRFKDEKNETNSNQETRFPLLAERTRSTLRFHTTYSVSSNVRFQSRIEYAFYHQENENERGFMAFQDVRYRIKKIPLTLTSRLALIDVSDYDARIYAYENDVLYAFSIPPYFGKSTRFYLLADYDFSRNFTLQVRFAQTAFSDREEISSGNQTIEGSKISEVKVMARVRF